ncbi:MAG: hypothetical protein RR454_00330 [Clostridia bacterium]
MSRTKRKPCLYRQMRNGQFFCNLVMDYCNFCNKEKIDNKNKIKENNKIVVGGN